MTGRTGWLIGAGVLVLVGAVVAAVLVFADDADPAAASCENGVSVYFSDDRTMHAAADRLRDDDRVGAVRTETREQARARGVRQYPQLEVAAKPVDGWEVTAPAVHLASADLPKGELADALARELPGADAAVPVTCGKPVPEQLSAMTARAPKLTCRHPERIWFENDEAMQAAVEPLRADPRVESVHGETEAEAFERFKEVFADEPELLETVRVGAVPASVELSLRPDTDAKGFVAEYRGKLSGVSDGREAEQVCLGLPHPVAAS